MQFSAAFVLAVLPLLASVSALPSTGSGGNPPTGQTSAGITYTGGSKPIKATNTNTVGQNGQGVGKVTKSQNQENWDNANKTPAEKAAKDSQTAQAVNTFNANQPINQPGKPAVDLNVKGDGVHTSSSDPRPHMTVEQRPADPSLSKKQKQKQGNTVHQPMNDQGNVPKTSGGTATNIQKPHKEGPPLNKRRSIQAKTGVLLRRHLEARSALEEAEENLLLAREAYEESLGHAVRALQRRGLDSYVEDPELFF